MKLKLPDLSDRVIVIKSDQQEANKCYENSLKTKRGVFMVVERPPSADTPMEEEPVEEAVPVGETPVEVASTEEAPEEAVSMEETPEAASPMEEAPAEATPRREGHGGVSRAESVRDRRPEPVENVVERQIGGKNFKLGRLLSQEEQDQVATVISRHLDAFAWSASDMPDIDPYFLCHHLTMDPKVHPVRQRRRKFNKERRLVVQEETRKLLSVGHIREI